LNNKTRWVWLLILLLVIIVGCTSNRTLGSASQHGQTLRDPADISCLGHIEPADGVARIAARSLGGQPSIIRELNVREGDHVRAGQVLAVLDSHDQLQAIVKDSEKKVAMAQAKLALIQAGVKAGDIQAQEAELTRLKTELAAFRSEFQRYDSLYQKQALTTSDYNQRALAVSDTEQLVKEAEARLSSMKEVRDVELHLAEAEVQAATADVARARAELAASIIHAPFDAKVLKVYAHPGEEVRDTGILELGKTDQMYVIAEVYETDLDRVFKEQRATVTGGALKKALQGNVESIGDEIAKNEVTDLDPMSLPDRRVIHAKIRLDDSATAEHLVHARVQVLIHH